MDNLASPENMSQQNYIPSQSSICDTYYLHSIKHLLVEYTYNDGLLIL